jgi:hypothetical protein
VVGWRYKRRLCRFPTVCFEAINWSNMISRLRSLCVVIIAPVAVFFEALLGRRLLAPGDGYQQYIPWYIVTARSWLAGHIPTWNPFAYAGSPHLATHQPAVFYAPNLLFLILDPVIANNVTIVINFAVAGIGAMLLTRHLSKDDAAGIVGGLAFGLSGFMFARIGHQSMLATAAWLPWILYSLELLRDRFSALRLTFAATAFGLSVLAGHSQILFVNILAILLYGVVVAVFQPKSGKFRSLALAAAVVAAGSALGALQLLPTAKMLPETSRARISYEEAMTFSFPSSHVVLLIFPYLFGNHFAAGPYSQPYTGMWNLTEMTGYPGAAALTLAAAGLGSVRRDRRVLALAVAGFVTAMLAFGPGTPLSKLLYRLPIYGQFRSWARFIFVFDLTVAVLAGFGVALLRHGEAAQRRAAVARTLVVAAAILAAAWLVPAWAGVRRFIPEGGPLLFTLAIPAMASLLGATAAALIWLKHRIGTVFVILVVALDVLVAFGGFYEWRNGSATVEQFKADLSRLPHSWGAVSDMPGGIDRYLFVGGDSGPMGREFVHATDMRGERSANGNNPLAPREYLDSVGMTPWGAVYSTDNIWSPESRVLDLLRISTVLVHPESADGGPRPGSLLSSGRALYGGQMVRYEYAPRLPDAFLVGTVLLEPRAQVLDALWGKTPFDPRTTALIEEACSQCPFAHNDYAGEIEDIEWGLNSVSVELEAVNGALLVVSQAWFPGWHAWVDGEEAQVLRVNGIVQGVPVAAGVHRVELVYRAPGLRLGFIISLFTLALFVAWITLEKLRARVPRSN